jgi:hypothetical protein
MGSMHDEHQHHGPGYATPAEAMAAPGEEIVYVAALHPGTGVERVIEPEEIKAKTGLSAPHTVHCMPGNQVVMSMPGDTDGGDGAGFAVLDAETLEVQGRWEANGTKLPWNHDFWYQPRKGYMVSSEWAAPQTFQDGFNLEDVAAGRYGHSLHVWDLERRQVTQDIDLGPEGMIPLEIRWLHDPDADFFVDFSPAKAHEIHLPGGDCTTEIFA